jgi:hypothetical protein
MTLGATAVGDPERGAAALDAMRAVAPPALDTFDVVPAAGLCRLHGDPEGPTPGMSHHALLARLDPAGIDRLVAVAGVDSGSPLVSVEVRHLGGAACRPAPGSGVLSRFGAPYVLNAVGMAATPAMGEESYRALGETVEAMGPWTAGAYLDFMERPGPSPFDAATVARLDAVELRLDPDGRFRDRLGRRARSGEETVSRRPRT